MESLSALPKWVKKSRNTLKQSQEWQTFMMSLYDIVHHQMQESGVGSFSDLSPPERKLLLQRAFQALKKSETYNKLIELASDSLDNSLAYEASNLSLLKSQSKTRIQILQSECHKAVSALLQRWPDGRTSLQMCLNSIIPSEIRYVLWKSFLNNQKAREDYLNIVASDPKKLVSDSDFEISQKCQNLLESVPTLRTITSKKATCSVMRHILSYRKTRTKENLIETDYLLSVPPVICTLSAYNTNNSLSAPKPLTTEALATLVEEFTVFMDKRPDYMMSKQGRSLTDISEKTGVILRRINVKLCNSMENYHVGRNQVDRSNSPTPGLQIVLSKLLHSVLRSMFVGFLPLDSVLHAWDIVVLGFDQPNYDPVPYLCASILLVLQEELMNCQTLKAAETALLRGCKAIDESRLAQAMSEYGFEKTLGENLSALQESQFPVFHPALESNMPPWKHWYSSKLIAHLQEEKWQSKQKAQTAIDDDAAKPSSSASGSSKAGQNQAWLLEQAKQELEEEVENLREERDALLEGLQEERRTRVDVQEYADEEIERLRRQIMGLQSLPDERVVMASPIIKSPTYDPSKHDIKAPPPSVSSSRSKVASPPAGKPAPKPPVSPEVEPEPVPSRETPNADPEVKPEKDDNEEIAMKVTNDLLAKMMEGINTLAQGSGKTRKELDQMSKRDIDKFHLALNKAQILIFGKSMSDKDLESLPTAARDEKMNKVREETVKRLFNIK